MKWNERDYQEYRERICSIDISTGCEDCTKTGEEIKECYWNIYFDATDEDI